MQRILEENVHVQFLLKSVGIMRSVQIALQLVILIMICAGPGFYLRQGWEARYIPQRNSNKNNTNGGAWVIRCGEKVKASIVTYEKCLVLGWEKDGHAVTSMAGFYGSCAVKLWSKLGFHGMYFSLTAMLLVLPLSTALLLLNTKVLKSGPLTNKTYELASLGFCAAIMAIVCALSFWYNSCGPYPSTTLLQFQQANLKTKGEYIAKKSASKDKWEQDPEYDVVVSCVVVGYGFAGVFALISAVLLLVDAKYTSNTEKYVDADGVLHGNHDDDVIKDDGRDSNETKKSTEDRHYNNEQNNEGHVDTNPKDANPGDYAKDSAMTKEDVIKDGVVNEKEDLKKSGANQEYDVLDENEGIEQTIRRRIVVNT